MTIKDELTFFKTQFAADIIPALAGTPISFDLVCAIAFQESGELWSKLRRKMSRNELLRLCVGDTFDAPNRSAFPTDKEHLLAAENGEEMFELAHRLLGEMGEGTGIEIYQHLAKNPKKFVHGYGIFQYDLQFFEHVDPAFFLEQRWSDIDHCVDKLMIELKNAVKQLGLGSKKSLSDLQSAFVAIVYNTGFKHFDQSRGLKQGHKTGDVFYGENIVRFLKIARTIPTPDTAATTRSAAVSSSTRLVASTVSAPLVASAPAIVAIAQDEFDKFNGIDEGDEPLRSRIADYYEAGGGRRDLDPTLNRNAWSAAFVSFCVKQSGATKEQFRFNLLHSVFVNAAIANRDADRGVFRGHPITEYAPQLGDLIHHNRDGSALTFEFARAHADYPSHSAVVVGFKTQNGVRHAVTIGGNEGLAGGTGTVGSKTFALGANGRLDQAHIAVRLICVVENQLARGLAPLPATPGSFTVNVRTDLKLRGGPGTEFDVLQSLSNGTRLNVLSFTDNASGRWALVDLGGDGVRDGFVFAQFLEPAAA